MIDYIKKSAAWAFASVTAIFTFVPESFFRNRVWIDQGILKNCKLLSHLDIQDINVVISRLACLCIVWIAISLLYGSFLMIRWKKTIKGQNYSISVEYGNILNKRNCKRVISFDECFTAQVGKEIADINSTSICGQYLLNHPNLDMDQLIKTANITPSQGRSKYQNKTCYTPGTIIQHNGDLLMAFARLDERGKGRFFSRDEYLSCLELLWKEIENYYSAKDVCIPILGAGTTTFEGGTGASYSQQELLDMMILSYKLSSHKIKSPHKLRIICKRTEGFSINNINA